MSKNKKRKINISSKEEDYYDLKESSVDELVNVLKKQSEEEPYEKDNDNKVIQGYNPYKIDRLSKIPTWIKALLIKFWFYGCICFFFFWGLGYYFNSMENLIIITGLATGIITDFIINTIFLYFESDKKEYHRFMLVPVPFKKIWTIFINIPFSLFEVFLVVLIYSLINYGIVNSNDLLVGTTKLNVEPLLYGLIYLGVDMFFITIKNFIVDNVKKLSR